MEYLNLEAGESAEIKVFWKQPRVYYRHWVAGKAVDCAGVGCQYCRRHVPCRQRNILHVERDGRVVCWVISPSILRTLRYLLADPADLSEQWFKVKRTGQGKRTQYRITYIF